MTNQPRPRIAIPVPTISDPEYNRRCWVAYAEAVRHSGGEPVEVPLTGSSTELTALFATCHGVVLPGSPADVSPARYAQAPSPACAAPDPAREQTDLILLDEAYHHRKPVLAVCFGTQMLNVWRGGTLVQDLSIMPVNHRAARGVAVAHNVAIQPESTLAAILRAAAGPGSLPQQDGLLRLPVNSSHHQALAIAGAGLRVTARCPQDDVFEAIEGDTPDHFVLGVQWHPERTFAENWASRAIFSHFMSQVQLKMQSTYVLRGNLDRVRAESSQHSENRPR